MSVCSLGCDLEKIKPICLATDTRSSLDPYLDLAFTGCICNTIIKENIRPTDRDELTYKSRPPIHLLHRIKSILCYEEEAGRLWPQTVRLTGHKYR